ncbi:MAG: Gfo/Idh/MocA family oxidoreductase [Armatimonadetes bacterium]|nr:Gfo/Idh/MocA family oxidoreductase [Armatimonadota bacterium]
MSDRVYSVMVVGMGKRGMHHATTFHANPRFKVVGICDIDTARLDAAAEKLGNPEKSSDAFEMVKRVKPDIYCFATMPHLRYRMIAPAVEAGVKLIAYEKPMAMTLKEGRQIMDLVRQAGVKTVVSHQHRYGEHYQKVKEIISSGALGRVHTVYGTATGWMLHMITHLIEYTRWYNDNADAEWVMASASGRGKLTDLHPSPDYVAGFIQFENGVRGIIETGAGAPDVPEVDYWWRKCRIGAQGTDGFAEALTGGGWRAVTAATGAISGGGCMSYDLDMPPYIADMAKWLDDDSAVHPCNGEDAYKGFEIMMAFCRSIAERGQVALPLTEDANEMEAMANSIPDKPVLLSTPENRKEYPE